MQLNLSGLIIQTSFFINRDGSRMQQGGAKLNQWWKRHPFIVEIAVFVGSPMWLYEFSRASSIFQSEDQKKGLHLLALINVHHLATSYNYQSLLPLLCHPRSTVYTGQLASSLPANKILRGQHPKHPPKSALDQDWHRYVMQLSPDTRTRVG